MGVPRPSVARRRLIRRVIAAVVGVCAVGGITWGLSRLGVPVSAECSRWSG